MGTTYRTSAGALTEQQLAMLRGLESKPIDDLEELGGYQTWTGLHSFAEPGTGESIVAEVVTMLCELAK